MASTAPSTWTRQLTILWLSQAGALSGASFTVPFTPLLVESVGVHDPGAVAVWTGAMFTISQGMQIFFAPIWGRVADRIGRKAMVMRAMFGVGTVLIITAFVPNIGALLVCRMLTGVFAGTPAATAALVAGTAPAERVAGSLGVVQSAGSVGGIAGPLLGVLIVPLVGLRPAFVVAGVLCLIGGLAVSVGVNEGFTRPDRSVAAPRTRQVLKDAGVMPVLLTLVVLAFFAQSASFASSPSLPLRATSLADSHHLAIALGAASAVQASCAALGALTVTRIARRIGYRTVLIAAALTASCAFVLVALAPSLAVLLAVVAFAGLATGMLLPAINTLLGRAAPARVRAEVFGYSASLMAVAGATMPLLATSLVPHFGTPAPFFLAATLQLLVATWAAVRMRARFHSALPQSVAASEAASTV